jgi:ferredoxin
MKIEVDQDRCCASGMCVLTDPDLFDQGEEDGTVILLNAEPSPEHHESAREAASVCPSGAIRVVE